MDPIGHTCQLIMKLSCVIRKLKNRSVCMQSAFLLFCCWMKNQCTQIKPIIVVAVYGRCSLSTVTLKSQYVTVLENLGISKDCP